jgi:hypothetical protein
VPVLLDAGGWKPADRAFNDQLEGFLQAFNEASPLSESSKG